METSVWLFLQPCEVCKDLCGATGFGAEGAGWGGPEVAVEFSIGVLLQILVHVTFAYIPTNGFRWGCVPLRCLCELDIE